MPSVTKRLASQESSFYRVALEVDLLGTRPSCTSVTAILVSYDVLSIAAEIPRYRRDPFLVTRGGCVSDYHRKTPVSFTLLGFG